MRKLYTVFFFIALFVGFATSQQAIKFNQLSINDELSQSSISSILQDSKGYMWFGSSNGLFKYDGVNLKQYLHNEKSKSSISDDYIIKIFEDKLGNLWIGTRNGLNLYERDKDRFIQFLSDNKKNSLPNPLVCDILEDSEGNLWIVSNYICILDRKSRIFKTLKWELQKDDENSAFLNYNFLFEDRQKNLWFGTWRNLYTIERGTHKFKHYLSADDLKAFKNERHFREKLQQDQNGTYWMGVNKYGLISFQFNEKITNLKVYDYPSQNSIKLSNYRFRKTFMDSKNNCWLGSENGGLFSYQINSGKLSHFINNPEDETTLCNNSIWAIYEDPAGRLWFGGFKNGISVIDPFGEKFAGVKYTSNNKGLSNNNVSAIWTEDNENIWIGTDGGGLNYYNRENNTFSIYKHDDKNSKTLGSDAVISICKDLYDNIWVGTWDGGLNLLRKGENNFVRFNADNCSLKNNDIYSLYSDDEGKIYAGTYGNGFYIFDYKKNTWINFSHDNSDPKSLSSNLIYSFCIDRHKNLWVGTFESGLNQLQYNSEGKPSFRHYKYNAKDSSSLSNNYVQCIQEDEEGYIWIGTLNGLNKLDPATGKCKVFNVENGLLCSSIQGILMEKDNIWISTLKGLSKYNKKDGKFRHYLKEDGLLSDQFNRNAAFKSSKGYLYFGGSKGFNYFHPDSLKDNPYPPKVVLTDFKLFNKSVPLGENSPLKKNISLTKEITLDYAQNVFTIDFAALDFSCSKKNLYAFKLLGLEKEWNYVGNRTSATYTSLYPKKYKFWVKASNNDGLWSEPEMLLTITVTPPFWKTLWFNLLMIFLIITGFIAFYYYRLLREKQKNEELHELVKIRTEEIEVKNCTLTEQAESLKQKSDELMAQKAQVDELNATKDKLFSILAHDLRNPFNVISGFSDLLLKDYNSLPPEKITKFLDYINTSSRKGNVLLENILHWSRIQTGRISYDPSNINLLQLVKETISLLDGDSQQKNIRIILKIVEDMEVYADENMLKTIIRNLTSNAIKFTPQSGVIKIEAETKDYTEISVTDTGTGISQEIIAKLFKIDTSISTRGTANESGTGIGLFLCREFTECHGGKIWVESEVGIGSKFSFTIPYKKNV